MQMFLIDGGCCRGAGLDLPHTWALVEAIHTNQSCDGCAEKGSLIHICHQLAASGIAAADWLTLCQNVTFFIFAMSKVESNANSADKEAYSMLTAAIHKINNAQSPTSRNSPFPTRI